MPDKSDEKTDKFNLEDEYLSEYHVASDLDPDIIQNTDRYKASDIVSQDEPIAVADNPNQGLTIEVYERRSHSILEKPKQVLGMLNDYILHINCENPHDKRMAEYKNLGLDEGKYFEFNRGDFQQVEDLLDQFSDKGYNTFIREEDVLSYGEAQNQFGEDFC